MLELKNTEVVFDKIDFSTFIQEKLINFDVWKKSGGYFHRMLPKTKLI